MKVKNKFEEDYLFNLLRQSNMILEKNKNIIISNLGVKGYLKIKIKNYRNFSL